MSTILLTGFQPFGSYERNPVEESTKHFDGAKIGSHTIVGLVLECTYKGAFEILKTVMDAEQPIAVISTGLSSSVPGIQFEITGRNSMHGKYPDANGHFPNGELIVPEGEKYVHPHANTLDLAKTLTRKGIPTQISTEAGGFICNSLLYLTSRYIAQHQLSVRNVFFHTPMTSECKGTMEWDPTKLLIPQEILHNSIEEVIKGIGEQCDTRLRHPEPSLPEQTQP